MSAFTDTNQLLLFGMNERIQTQLLVSAAAMMSTPTYHVSQQHTNKAVK